MTSMVAPKFEYFLGNIKGYENHFEISTSQNWLQQTNLVGPSGRGSTSRSGPAVPQARAGSERLRVLGVQALASPHSGRFADVSLDTTRSHRASFRFLAHAGPFGVWQLKGVMRPRLESLHNPRFEG